MTSRVPVLLVLALAGCGGGDHDDGPSPPRWPGEDLAPCDTTTAAYLIDAITLPVTAAESAALAQDLDGDGDVDNHLGNVIQTLITTLNLDIQERIDGAIATDALPIAITVETCGSPPYALLELHRGLAVDRGVDPPRVTAVDETALASVGLPPSPDLTIRGEARFPVLGMFEAEDAAWLEGWNLRFDLRTHEPERIAGRLALGVDAERFFEDAVVVMTLYLNERIEGQPGCPDACESQTLDFLLEVFDTDRDGVFEREEIAASPIVQDLAAPDLDLLDEAGTYWPAVDGERDTLSFGLGFSATRATLGE